MSEDNVISLRPVSTVRASTLSGEPPRREWHVPGWIPAKTVTLLTGDGGVGKSTLALQLAVSTATNRPWLGQTPRSGPVVYMAAEDDLSELHRRLDEICIGTAIGLAELKGLSLWPLADEDAVLATEARNGLIETTERWAELYNLALELRPSLIVLDSLADVFGGNENVRAQVRQFIGQLRRLALSTGGAVLVLSHPSLAGMSSGSGSSGSTAWHNSVRSRLYFTTPKSSEPDYSADPDLRILSHMKANYGPKQSDMQLRREAGGFSLISGGGTTSKLNRVAEERRVDALFLQLLDIYTVQARPVSDTRSVTYAPAVFAKDAIAKGCTKDALAAAMNRLIHAGDIRIEITGPPSKERRRLVRSELTGRRAADDR